MSCSRILDRCDGRLTRLLFAVLRDAFQQGLLLGRAAAVVVAHQLGRRKAHARGQLFRDLRGALLKGDAVRRQEIDPLGESFWEIYIVK